MTVNALKIQGQKGLSGISTLIIFIAIILAAAVAALVLLQTIGGLQSQALATGSKSKEEISTGIQIEKVIGYVPQKTEIDYLRIITKLAPGSTKIGLTNTVLSYEQGGIETGVDINREIGGGDNNNSVEALKLTMDSQENNDSYDVIWLGKHDTYDSGEISELQRVEFWYDCPDLPRDTRVEITIYPSTGTPARAPFRSPKFYDKNYLTLYP